jgi:hypothetical protein
MKEAIEPFRKNKRKKINVDILLGDLGTNEVIVAVTSNRRHSRFRHEANENQPHLDSTCN